MRAIDRSRARRVVIVAFPGCQVLDVAGPHEVFAGADRLVPGSYRVEVRSADGGLVASESGLTISTEPLGDPAELLVDPPDTVLVVGGDGVQAALHDVRLVDWVSATARCARRIGSVCSGAFVLGAAGLLDGRRVTTHWARAAQLAADFPAADVDADPIWIHDGVWTSAGVTAGIDLALAMVEADLGVDHAQTAAQWLVMFLRRPGTQSQFAAPVWQRPASHDGIRAVVDAVHAEPGADHTVGTMAAIAAMSPRHFTRVFTRELGTSPGRFVEQVRIDAARRRLETTAETTDVIARSCGFGTAETMRRSFVRSLGTPPSSYRRRFTHHPRHVVPSDGAGRATSSISTRKDPS